MKNNIILLLIDSMNNSHIKDSEIELTPFLNKLKKEGLFCEDMYSEAPYTEAANMSIYCGTDVLDNGGYMFRYKDAPLTLFEVMKELGYKTYYNDFQPQCHPSSVRRGVDHIYYSVGYDLGALWSYRLSHYADLYRNGNMKDEDYLVLIEIFRDNLNEWLRFTKDIQSKDISTNMIINNAPNYDADKVQKSVQEQLLLFEKNPKSYIDEVLKEGKNHVLFSIPAYNQNNKTRDRDVVEWVRSEYKPLIKRIKHMDFILNIKNCRGLTKGPIKKLGAFIKKPSKNTLKDFFKSGYLVWNQLFDSDLKERISNNCDNFKNAPSLRTHIDHYINWALENDDDTPHFAFMHVDDIHNPEVFFTYDSSDTELLKNEMNQANDLLDRIPKNYYGSLSHDLSLQYIDGVIKYLYDELQRIGLSEKTNVIICADHGFSFSGNPLRDSFIVNFYLENYNIPFVITGPGIPNKQIEGLHASKDIPATICGLTGEPVPESFKGIDIVHSDDCYSSLIIEYCGGGCPDLTRREIKLAAFDNKYFLGTLATLDEPISAKNITEIYDLEKDPKQKHNLVKRIEDYSQFENLIKVIESRKLEIKKTMKGY